MKLRWKTSFHLSLTPVNLVARARKKKVSPHQPPL